MTDLPENICVTLAKFADDALFSFQESVAKTNIWLGRVVVFLTVPARTVAILLSPPANTVESVIRAASNALGVLVKNLTRGAAGNTCSLKHALKHLENAFFSSTTKLFKSVVIAPLFLLSEICIGLYSPQNSMRMAKEFLSKSRVMQEIQALLKTNPSEIPMVVGQALPDLKKDPQFFYDILSLVLNENGENRIYVGDIIDKAHKNFKENAEFFGEVFNRLLSVQSGYLNAPGLISKIGEKLKDNPEFFYSICDQLLSKENGYLKLSELIECASPRLKKDKEFFIKLIDKSLDPKILSMNDSFFDTVLPGNLILVADESIRKELQEYSRTKQAQDLEAAMKDAEEFFENSLKKYHKEKANNSNPMKDFIKNLFQKQPRLQDHAPFFLMAIDKTLTHFPQDGHAFVDEIIAMARSSVKNDTQFFLNVLDKIDTFGKNLSNYPSVVVECIIKKANVLIQNELKYYAANKEKAFNEKNKK